MMCSAVMIRHVFWNWMSKKRVTYEEGTGEDNGDGNDDCGDQ